MDEELKTKLDSQELMLAKIYKSSEATRKYFMWTLIITLLMFFLPILGLIFVIPSFISTYSEMFKGL